MSHDAGPGVDAADSAPPNGEDAGLDASKGEDAGSRDAGTDSGGDTGLDAGAGNDDAGNEPDAKGGGGDDDAGGTDGASSDGNGGGGHDAGPPADAGTIVFVSRVQVSTLAGSSVAGTQDGTGSAAQFNNPTGMAVDQAGNLLVTDYGSSLVRLVTPQGAVTTLAWAKNFVGPFAAVVATDGTYYVETDYDTLGVKTATSGTVWRVSPLGDGGVALPGVLGAGVRSSAWARADRGRKSVRR